MGVKSGVSPGSGSFSLFNLRAQGEPSSLQIFFGLGGRGLLKLREREIWVFFPRVSRGICFVRVFFSFL